MKPTATELQPSDAPSSPKVLSEPLLTMVGLGPPVEDADAPVAGTTAYVEIEAGPGTGDKRTLVGFPGTPEPELIDAVADTLNDAVTTVSSFDEITVVAQAPFLGRAMITRPPEPPAADEPSTKIEPEVPTSPDASPALEASSESDTSDEAALLASPVASPEPVAAIEPVVSTEPIESAAVEPVASTEPIVSAAVEPVVSTEPIVSAAVEPVAPTDDAVVSAAPDPALSAEPVVSAAMEPVVSAAVEPAVTTEPLAVLDAFVPTLPAPPPDGPLEPLRALIFEDLPPPVVSTRRTLAQSFAVRTPPPTLTPPPLAEADPALKIFPPSLDSLVPPPRKFRVPVAPASASTTTQSDAPWFVSVPPEKSRSRLSRLPPAQRIAVFAMAAGAAVALGAFALLPSTGHLLVTVAGPQDGVVPGSVVFVDGERACAPAPCRVTIPSGSHTISVAAPLFRRTAEKSLVVGRGSEEALHFTLLPDDRAALEIRVPTEGFRVYLDGKERGTAPTILRGLTPGEHTLQVSGHPRYAPFEQKVMLAADRLLVLAPSLVPAATAADLEPVLAADPVSFRELRAGGTENKPSAPSAPPAPTPPVLPAAVVAPVAADHVDLDKVPGDVARGSGKLSISSTPACNVVLDGRPIGPTPHEITVSAGPHSIVFIHPSKGRKSMRVEATPGKTAVAAMSF